MKSGDQLQILLECVCVCVCVCLCVCVCVYVFVFVFVFVFLFVCVFFCMLRLRENCTNRTEYNNSFQEKKGWESHLPHHSIEREPKPTQN